MNPGPVKAHNLRKLKFSPSVSGTVIRSSKYVLGRFCCELIRVEAFLFSSDEFILDSSDELLSLFWYDRSSSVSFNALLFTLFSPIVSVYTVLSTELRLNSSGRYEMS